MASLEDEAARPFKEAEIKETHGMQLTELRAMQEAEMAELRGESTGGMQDLASVRKRFEDEKASRMAEIKRRSEMERCVRSEHIKGRVGLRQCCAIFE